MKDKKTVKVQLVAGVGPCKDKYKIEIIYETGMQVWVNDNRGAGFTLNDAQYYLIAMHNAIKDEYKP